MAEYRVNGSVYHLPDDVSPERAMAMIQSSGGSAVSSPVSPTEAPAQAGASPSPDRVQAEASTATSAGKLSETDHIDPDTLTQDQDWLDASLKVWHYNNADEFKGNAKDLAEYGLDQMGWFNYNLPAMTVDAARLRSADDETKKSFVHLMDKYDKLEMSWSGAGRFVKGAALDPTNYLGLASLGIGTVASSGAKIATKEGIKELLKAGVVGAVEAGILTGTQDSVMQGVKIDAGTQEGFDNGELARSVGIGLVGGEVLGAAARGATKLLGKEAGFVGRAVPKADEEAQRALDSATQAVHGSATPVPGTPENAVLSDRRGLETVTAGNDNVPKDLRNVSTTKLGTGELTFKDGQLVIPGEAKATQDAAAAAREPARAAEPKPYDPNTRENPGNVANDDHVGWTPHNEPNVIIAAIQKYAGDTGARIFSHGADLAADSAEAVKVITSLKPEEVKAVVDGARRGKLQPEAQIIAKDAFQKASQKISEEMAANRKALDLANAAKDKDFKVIGELQKRSNDLMALYEPIRAADQRLSSITGHELQGRVGATDTGSFRELSPDSILKKKGMEPTLIGPNHPERRVAEAEFQRKLEFHRDLVSRQETVKAMEAEVDELWEAGDRAGALIKSDEAWAMREKLAKDMDQDPQTMSEKVNALAHSGWQKTVEYAISMVFKTSTLLVNLVPHLILTPTRPMVDFLLKGGSKEAYVAMKAGYVAMYQHSGEALRAALASFKYEADLLTAHGANSADKFLEHSATIKGLKGQIIRTFPRILTATDQLFKRTNYRSYVASTAAAQAFKDGLAAGWKPGEPIFEKWLKDETQKALDHSFGNFDGIGQTTISFMRQQGIRRGMKPGPKLNQWITQELNKNADLFRTATSESGRFFADDMAFRKEFSGDGFTSSMAKSYEGFVNQHPWMKFFGQLFFRTPVRVFEEGARLTPGLNMITPGFLRDLRGAGLGGPGGTAQLRAQGEAMLSLAFASATFTAYANGSVTGGGITDWRMRKSQTNAGFEPYTITYADGTKTSFRNFDPFATPFKIMINALDRFADLQYRQAQGEMIGESDVQMAIHHVVAPALAVVQSVKDANLAEGISELIDFANDATDPEKNSQALVQFLARKAQLAIPNQYTTIAQITQEGGTNFHDPRTLDQYLLARVNPGLGTIPKRYDAMGNDLKNANPMAGLYGVLPTSTKGMREAVMDKKSMEVNTALNELTVATHKVFVAPTTPAGWASGSGLPTGGLSDDLRETLTRDGKETLYDRMNRYVNQSNLKDRLHAFLVENPRGSIGTPTAAGSRTETVQQMIQLYRNSVFVRVMKEEGVFKEEMVQAYKAKLLAQSGRRDAEGAPFQ